MAADVLRILVKGYAGEAEVVREQIVLLGAKVYLHYLNARKAEEKADGRANGEHETKEQEENKHEQLISPAEEKDGFREDAFGDSAGNAGEMVQEQSEKPHPVELLYQHTQLLARYTPSYALRDRARLFRALLAVPASTELASLLLLAPKPVPLAPSPSASRKGYTLGSASLVIDAAGLRGYERIPDWVEAGREPDPALRDEVGVKAEYVSGDADRGPVSAGSRLDEALRGDVGYKANGGGVKGKEKTLDAWLNDEVDEESEESGDEETEGSETEGSSEEESEEDSSSEEEDEEAEGLVR